ncbi:MAG: L-2-hydroxyglutarate oxidase [Streptosporangiaceae bacterium]
MKADFCVVGAGIVGLAVARELLLRQPGATVVVLEKEPQLARHQTSHNSGVVHAGIYYSPESVKGQLVRRGVSLLREFCQEHDIVIDDRGKIIVARDSAELDGLTRLHDRARALGVPGLEMLGPDGISDREPHVTGAAGLLSPTSAITDFPRIAATLARVAGQQGAAIRLGEAVRSIAAGTDDAAVTTRQATYQCRRLVVCAGLQADRLAVAAGGPRDPQVVPFRGEYYRLQGERSALVRSMIYPVPDPRYPFLGVHFTPRVDGNIDVGPNAIMALARQGYSWGTISPRDLAAMAAWPGMWRLAARHWRTGLHEFAGSVSKSRFLARARDYVPSLQGADLVRAPAGVRAQAVSRDGKIIDDFVLSHSGPVTFVRNAPSPAATSSLAIAQHIAESVLR